MSSGNDPKTPRLLASKNTNEVNRAGGKIEQDVIEHGTPYYGEEKGSFPWSCRCGIGTGTRSPPCG